MEGHIGDNTDKQDDDAQLTIGPFLCWVGFYLIYLGSRPIASNIKTTVEALVFSRPNDFILPNMVQALHKKRTPWRETPLIESTNLSKAAGW